MEPTYRRLVYGVNGETPRSKKTTRTLQNIRDQREVLHKKFSMQRIAIQMLSAGGCVVGQYVINILLLQNLSLVSD